MGSAAREFKRTTSKVGKEISRISGDIKENPLLLVAPPVGAAQLGISKLKESLVPDIPQLPSAPGGTSEADIEAQQQRTEQQESELAAIRDLVLKRNRQQTILTSARGVLTPPETRRKTLLGQ